MTSSRPSSRHLIGSEMAGLWDSLWFDRAVQTFLLRPLLQFIIRFHIDLRLALEFLVRVILVLQGRGFVGDSAFESKHFNDTYDFIVVGGGIAGCTVANRLAVNHSVLLIQGPGGAPSPLNRIAFLVLFNLNERARDFSFTSEPVADDYWKRSWYTFPVGKDLGGSQTLSGGVWSYGKLADYQAWQKFGINSINFDTLRRYGSRHERMADDFVNNGTYRYGEMGELHLKPAFIPDYFQRYLNGFLAGGAQATSTQEIHDPNDGQLGFSKAIFAARDGFVSSGPRSYFEGRQQPRLHIA